MSQPVDDNNALMAEVFEKIPSAVIVIDEHGVIKRANRSAQSLLNEPKLEQRRWVEVIATVFRPRNDDGHEISTRDGRRLQVTTLPLEHGQLVQMTDLTETRTLQDKLSHMERLSSLGRMAASLAHQIRTPLSAAILYAHNLGNAKLAPPAHARFQEKLMNRLEAIEAQVSDILMFARSNEQTVSEIDATSLVEQTANNVTALLIKGNASLETVSADIRLPILGNAPALIGALSNLIANGVEAGASHVVLKLSCERDKVIFEVANDGPRIPDELKSKIFEPFFTSKSSGTGLGLAVVTAVTKVHQGIVTLSSWNDTFATVFSITVPLYTGGSTESAPGSSSSVLTAAQRFTGTVPRPAAATAVATAPAAGAAAAGGTGAAPAVPAAEGGSQERDHSADNATSAAFAAYIKEQSSRKQQEALQYALNPKVSEQESSLHNALNQAVPEQAAVGGTV